MACRCEARLGDVYVVWDHSPCVWFCMCRPIEKTLRTVVWDQQRSRCEAHRCKARALFGITPLVCGVAYVGR